MAVLPGQKTGCNYEGDLVTKVAVGWGSSVFILCCYFTHLCFWVPTC